VEKLSQFTLKRRVAFHETDAAGIVHFSCFLRYVEEAEHALWRAAGLSVAPRESEYGWPRVAVAAEFRNPLRFEDEFEALIRIVAITDKSIRYECALTRGDVHVATLTMTSVCVAKATGRAAAIPAVVRDRLEVSDVVVA
jgi:YbgC/YbaW family acyl-CoA thioester hydrolase